MTKKDLVKTTKIEPMWRTYQVELKILDKFASALPRTEEEIRSMLINHMPMDTPGNYIPFEELVDEIAE